MACRRVTTLAVEFRASPAHTNAATPKGGVQIKLSPANPTVRVTADGARPEVIGVAEDITSNITGLPFIEWATEVREAVVPETCQKDRRLSETLLDKFTLGSFSTRHKTL